MALTHVRYKIRVHTRKTAQVAIDLVRPLLEIFVVADPVILTELLQKTPHLLRIQSVFQNG